MRPHCFARIIGNTAWVHRNTDFRFTVMVRSKSSSVRSSTPLTIAMPALLTRMSIGASSDFARSTILATASACETSADIATARPPLSPMVLASASASAVRSR